MSWLHTLNPIFEGNFAAIEPINSQTHKLAIICATVASSQTRLEISTFGTMIFTAASNTKILTLDRSEFTKKYWESQSEETRKIWKHIN